MTVDNKGGRPVIRKLGTIDCDLVETTPVVFGGRLLRFEYVRGGYAGNDTGDTYFRFTDRDTGQTTPPFARGYHLGNVMVAGDRACVTGTNKWGGEIVDLFVSTDLERWEKSNALTLAGWGLYNTSMCQADDKYVLMIEVGEPPEIAGVRFTARFATSTDLKHWEMTPPECTYSKDRYTAPHALRWLDGWYYNFYLEAFEGYEQHVVRSRDLIDWEASPYNPVLRASEEDRRIANPALTPDQRERIAAATDINNSDIDFCEHDGHVVINYCWGNQLGVEFLAEAVYDGTLREFLTAWYP